MVEEDFAGSDVQLSGPEKQVALLPAAKELHSRLQSRFVDVILIVSSGAENNVCGILPHL